MFDYNTLDEQLKNDVRVRKVIQLVGSGKRVLDLGCFSGYILGEIKKKF